MFLPAQPLPKVIGHHTYRLGPDTWRITQLDLDPSGEDRAIRIEKNGKPVFYQSSDRLMDAVLIRWPYKGRLLAISRHTWAGHGVETSLYRADRKGVHDLKLKLTSEVYGPTFPDLNHDGRPELMFDNYDWYEFHNKPPTKFIVYRYNGSRLLYDRTLPNPKARHLPYRLPSF